MKKVLSIILVIIILFSMVGCRKMEEGEVRNESTVEDFAEAAGVSIEFAQSLNDAVGQIQENLIEPSILVMCITSERQMIGRMGKDTQSIWLRNMF